MKLNARIRVVAVLWLVLSLGLSWGYENGVAHADNSGAGQYFPQTKHTVSGKFLSFWQANGGLATFGYPISEAANEVDPQTGQTFLTQWFERSRFELHPEKAGTPYEVELGLLGRQVMHEALTVDPRFLPTTNTPPYTVPGVQPVPHQFVPETGHNIYGDVLKYWSEHGGAAIFGLPISEAYGANDLETAPAGGNSLNYQEVQWFERARFEIYTYSGPVKPPQPGQPSQEPQQHQEIRLGLLGSQLHGGNPPPYSFMWQTAIDRPTFSNYGIGLDSAGNIFVSDGRGLYMTKYDQAGHQLEQWRVHEDYDYYGQGNTHALPMTIDAHDNIFVVDNSNDFVKKFDPHGKLLAQWGGGGSQDGHFLNPLGIAVDNAGNVYVADTDNDRIQKFDSDGHYLSKWGTRGGNDGQLIGPEGVTTDNQGHVYVADSLNNRIQKFDANGQFLGVWGGSRYDNKQFGGGEGIATDKAGNVFLASNPYIYRYDNSGHFLSKLDTFPPTDGRFNKPTGGALDAQGNLYVTDAGNYRVQKLDGQGHFLLKWGSQGNGDGQFNFPTGIAIDASGNVYVADNDNSRIQKFDSTGKFLLGWGSAGNGDGQFQPPTPSSSENPYGELALSIGGLAVDSQGHVYVADIGNNRVQKFDSNGRFLAKWEVAPYNDGSPNHVSTPVGEFPYPIGPTSIAIDGQNNIYVVSTEGRPILKYDTSGQLLNKWIFVGTDAKNELNFFPTEAGVATDSAGNVFVSDTFDQVLQKFDSNGQLLQLRGKLQSGYRLPHGPFQGLALDNKGHIFLLDFTDSFIQKYQL